MRTRPARALSNQVVIVAIDDKSIAELGHWMWPRSVFANLQNAFIDYKVKVVGYDILFSEVDGIDVEREAIAQRLHGSVSQCGAVEIDHRHQQRRPICRRDQSAGGHLSVLQFCHPWFGRTADRDSCRLHHADDRAEPARLWPRDAGTRRRHKRLDDCRRLRSLRFQFSTAPPKESGSRTPIPTRTESSGASLP